jgi:hypothetical protein
VVLEARCPALKSSTGAGRCLTADAYSTIVFRQFPMSRFVDPYYVANSLLLLVLQPLHIYFTEITPEGSQYSKMHTLSDFYTWVRFKASHSAAAVA